MANDKGGPDKKGTAQKSFKQHTNQPKTDHSLTEGYIKKSVDPKIIQEPSRCSGNIQC